MEIIERALVPRGFIAHRMKFREQGTADVENLFIRTGTGGKHFCFAGHVDVVPPGEEKSWTHPPFAGVISDGMLFGRGAVDMKGAVAAFAAAAADFVERKKSPFPGSISLLLTADEEGAAVNGTAKAIAALKERSAIPDDCLVGEPTSRAALGDAIKIGRRGSLRARISAKGRQGHSAYPHLADNPIPKLVRLLDRLAGRELDRGTEHFDPSFLTISTVDVGNPISNIIPERAEARLNIRFNPLHTSNSLITWLADEVQCIQAEMGGEFDLHTEVTGEAFLSIPGALAENLTRAIRKVTGLSPELSTSGGTSDARFIRAYCPVVEFGPLNATIHQTDERIALDELVKLKAIYLAVLEDYFSAS